MPEQSDYPADFDGRDPSVTRWLVEFEQGDQAAAKRLWEFLRQRLLQSAKKEVDRAPRPTYDEEDVAQSAFHTLCDVIKEDRYSITDRDELWRLAIAITVNKARNRTRHENRIRRGGGFKHADDGNAFLNDLVSREPPADVALIMEEECQRLLSRLQQRDVQLVALLKVEGYTDKEVAGFLGCTRRSVQRRLALIRDLWAEEVA